MTKQTTFIPRVYDLLKRYGYRWANVEQWEDTYRGTRIRRDFPYNKYGGFADVLCWHPLDIRGSVFAPVDGFDLRGVLAIQVCSESTMSNHFNKIVNGEPYADVRDWLLSGNSYEIWGFPRNSRKSRLVGNKRELNIRVFRFTFDDQLYWEEGTQLEVFGYIYKRRQNSA